MGPASSLLQLCPIVPGKSDAFASADCRGIFDLEVYDIKGQILNLNKLSGRFVLVVNVHPSDPHWDAQLEWMGAESESCQTHPQTARDASLVRVRHAQLVPGNRWFATALPLLQHANTKTTASR